MFEYSGQIRRFVTQFIKIVSNFEVEYGRDEDGGLVTRRVPVIYGEPSRQVAQIMQNNSENTLNVVPVMSVYVSSLDYDRNRVMAPTFTNKSYVRQREFDTERGTYTHRQGDAFTIERHMAVPYKLGLKLDIWTSNTEQKLQIMEQLAVLFNPELEIQNTDQYFDWTSLSMAVLTGTVWDSRTVPTGNSEPISIATMSFELPIWISPPAKVKKLGVIHKTIGNIWDFTERDQWDLLSSQIITLYDFAALLDNDGENYRLRLLDNKNIINKHEFINSQPHRNWRNLLEQYGRYIPGSSKIRLMTDEGYEIIGTIEDDPNDPYSLIYTPFVDTIPSNTLAPIDSIVDPYSVNVDAILTNVAAGTRYMLVDDIGSNENVEGAIAWRGQDGSDLIAHSGDIVEYNGTKWEVVFDSRVASSTEYLTNIKSNTQYKWDSDANTWVKSIEGIYRGGQWGINL